MSVNFPEPAKVNDLLSRLLDDAPRIGKDDTTPELASLSPTFASLCVDDRGDVVAAVVADLSAALCLGGKLMMMPIGRIEEQAKTGKLDAMLLDALTEVFNNIASCLNEVEDNVHVRSMQAGPTNEQIEQFGAQWLLSASNRVDLVGEFLGGPGRIVFVGK